ncbi:Orn/Lys/Arg family decarboxylase [Escherichia coli]
MFAWLKRKQPWRTVERSLFRPAGGGSHPREAYNAIVDNNVELVSIENLPGRIAANSVIPYPQESRCCCLVKTSAIKQSASKLFTLAAILGPPFPWI